MKVQVKANNLNHRTRHILNFNLYKLLKTCKKWCKQHWIKEETLSS